MALSNNLISQFVKVTDDTDKSKKEKSTYGTVKEYNGEKYVQIDGSNMLTPYFSTTIVKDGDRVVVDLKDHNAVVSGNITSPATRSDDFNSEVTNTAENFKATNASIDTLKVKQGQFEELATEKLNAAEANIDVLAAREANFESVTTENFATTNASIENLSGDFANFKVTTTDSLTANEANITKVSGDLADFITVTTDTFKSTDAEITNLKTAKADIDLANIDVANIGILFNKVGLIDRATIVDGHITGFLDAVEINANNITAGTLIADRILLKGSENGLLYQLNNLGELTSTNVDTLDGSILTERTVTADKLVAKSITTNELDVDNIFGNSAVLSTLVSQQAFINAISTNSVVVGASNAANNALNTVNNLEIGGRNLLKGTNKTGVTYIYPPSGYTDWKYWTTTIPLNGDTYTLSFWAKSTVNGDILRVHFYNPSNVTSVKGSQGQTGDYADGRCDFTLSTTLTKYWVTYTIPKGGNSTRDVIIPRLFNVHGSGTITLQWEKLEEGNKATDWTPAPEDISVENIYTPNTTTIDGGKITTNSIKAQQISSGAITTDKLGANAVTAEKLSVSNLNAIAAKIGDFSLDTRLYATATGYINPTTADYTVMKNAFKAGTLSSLYNQNIYWDLDGDGDVDFLDYAYVKNMMWNASYNYQGMAHKKASAINLEINPSDPYKMIKMSGTNAWGTHVEAYYGLNGMKTPKVVSDGADIGDGGVHCSDDVIAGWGTDNEVSLQTLNSNLGYPDYAYSSLLKGINDTGAHKDESVTISNNGFVFFRAANGSTTTSIFWRLKINDFTVSEGHTISRNYTYAATAIYPVKKGDVVKISCSNQTSARLYFFPLRKA